MLLYYGGKMRFNITDPEKAVTFARYSWAKSGSDLMFDGRL